MNYIAVMLLLAGWAPDCAAWQPASASRVKVSTALSKTGLEPGGSGVVAVVFDIDAKYHAQSHTPIGEENFPLEVVLSGGREVTVGTPVYPPGEDHEYKLLGKLNVYTGRVVVFVPVKVASDAKPGTVVLAGKAVYQVCDDGMCYAPERPALDVPLTIVAAGASVSDNRPELFKDYKPASETPAAAPKSSGSGARQSSAEWSTGFALGVAFLAGLLFNIMPCVLPVLPLKALGFYEASQHDRAKTFSFGIAFSLGLILVFTALALLVILSKSIFGHEFQWGQWFSIGWVVWAMTLVLVLLGASMLGAFTVNLPTSIYGLNFRHDTLSGNVMWGAFTAILSTPCTAPMFAYLLGWAVAQPVTVATLGMITVGLGMASPYLFLSAFPELARRFPRTGPASELVKQSMAFLMFGTAAWLVGPRLVGDPNQYWLIVAVVAWGSVFLAIRGATILKSSISVLVLSTLIVGLLGGSTVLAMKLTSKKEGWQPYTAQSFDDARKSGRIVLVKFTAAWCANCKYIEQTVYTDTRALNELKQRNVILLKADLTYADAPGWKLLNELGVSGIPFTAIYAPGAEKPETLASIYTTDGLIESLDGLP